ncbi:MAG: efflux RND transporter periplasmic adaptor subunit [Propionicimonas sp.]
MAEGRHKRPPAPVIIVVLLLLLGGGTWWWWSTNQTVVVDNTLRASGSAESREYQITPALTGRVTAVKIAEGDTVKAGQLLVRLDTKALTLQLNQAKQGVKAAEAAVTNAKNDEDATNADVKAAQARLAQAKAAVDLARVQLSFAVVKAPRGGTIVSLTTNVGQNAAPGRAVVTMTDPADVFVRVFVPEPRIGQVSVGQAVTVSSGSTPDITGKVTFIASTAEFTPNTVQTEDQRVNLVFEVRVRLDDTSQIKAGMPADVAFG